MCFGYRWHNHMFPCMLLAKLSTLPYWIIVCVSMLCVYYMYMWILIVYVCMHQCMECQYLCFPLLITLKDYSVILCNVMYFCVLICSGVLFHIHWYLYT